MLSFPPESYASVVVDRNGIWWLFFVSRCSMTLCLTDGFYLWEYFRKYMTKPTDKLRESIHGSIEDMTIMPCQTYVPDLKSKILISSRKLFPICIVSSYNEVWIKMFGLSMRCLNAINKTIKGISFVIFFTLNEGFPKYVDYII